MEEIPYAQAFKELETILGAFENDRLDVDDVEKKIKRAQELLEICRAKVERGKLAIARLTGESGAQV